METKQQLKFLRSFISPEQISSLTELYENSEEKEFFIKKIDELHNTCTTMPKTYEQDGKGDEAVAYLHYFYRNCDWYITERDCEDDQLQAFGLADIGHGAELGYIAIDALLSVGAEMDFYFEPMTVGEIKKKHGNVGHFVDLNVA